MVGEETFENIEGNAAEKFADLLLTDKLFSSSEFTSYESALVTDSPSVKSTKKK
jgi:hypothetical protein